MKKYIGLSIIALSMGMASCNDFLDELPDNRTEANTEEKIQKLLISAYPTHEHIIFTEYGSDNMDDMGETNPYTDRFLDQCFSWTDITEIDNGDPDSYWTDLYDCIEAANVALEGIESMGGATTTTLKEMQAEALLCRAYAHFMLVNIFALHYDVNNPDAVGISYIAESEKELNPKYQRETVHENYKHIEADLEAALPNVGDSYYDVPKYHFNKNAAYAFATRFYLYYEKYDKVIEYANKVLGSNPQNMLRDWAVLQTMPMPQGDQAGPTQQHFIDPTINSNLLLLTSFSRAGVYFGGYYTGKRYSHNSYVGTNETIYKLASLWGTGTATDFAYRIKQYSGTNLNTWLQWRIPALFEYTDPVAGIGYYHNVYNAFTGDEVLLNRAEAYIMQKDYENACADMTTWIRSVGAASVVRNFTLTTDQVNSVIGSMPYSYDDENGTPKAAITSTLRKHLNPKFEIDTEGSTQENMIQAVLAMRRYETLHEGKRWFDIKRWGIEIPRRTMDSAANPLIITDWLTVDDPRRAIQIPQKTIEAGYAPNPRVSKPNNDVIGNEYLLKD